MSESEPIVAPPEDSSNSSSSLGSRLRHSLHSASRLLSHMNGGGGAGGCLGLVRALRRKPWTHAHWAIVREGVPLALYGLFAALPAMLATVAAGHMGVHELAVVALAVAVFFTLPQSVGVGSALVFQGQMSMCVGKNDVTQIRLTFQRSVISAAILFPLMGALTLASSTSLFELFGQKHDTSIEGTVCIALLLPGEFFMMNGMFMYRTLIAQLIVWPGTIGTFSLILLLAGALYTVYSFKLGIYGICAALSVAQFVYFVCFATYFFLLKSQRRYEFYHVEASTVKSCVKQVVLFIKTILFAISIRIFIEVGTIVTGFLSEHELAAQSILLRYAMVIISLTFSLSTVPITHMGRAAGQAEHIVIAQPSDADAHAVDAPSDSAQVNAYGAGGHQNSDADANADSGSIQAGPEVAGSGAAALRGRAAFLLFFRATLNIYLVISVFVILFLSLFRTQLARYSTSIASVANLVDRLTPYVTIFVVLQIVWQALCSVAFSRSRVNAPVLISLMGDYVVGIPSAVLLMFLTPFRLSGFYVGLIGAHCAKLAALCLFYAFAWMRLLPSERPTLAGPIVDAEGHDIAGAEAGGGTVSVNDADAGPSPAAGGKSRRTYGSNWRSTVIADEN